MVHVTDKQIYMDDWLKSNIDFGIKRCEKKDLDSVLLISGSEGAGKSSLGRQIGYYVAAERGKNFTHENIFFNIEDIGNFASRTHGEVIIWDEAALGGLAQQWQDNAQMKLVQLLITCRKKNHFFIFIIPEFKSLKNYLAVHRSNLLIEVYMKDRIERGFFKVYGANKKKHLYLTEIGKSREKVIPAFFGRFIKDPCDLIDMDKYEKAKDEAIASIFMGEGTQDKSWKNKAYLLLRLLVDGKEMSITDISRHTKLDRSELNRLYNSQKVGRIQNQELKTEKVKNLT